MKTKIENVPSAQTEKTTVQQPLYSRLKQTILPQLVRNLLASCPNAGSGVHRWIYYVAGKLNPHFPDKDELERLLEEATANCGREVPAREIEDAVRNSDPARSNALGQTQTFHRWPNTNQERISRNWPTCRRSNGGTTRGTRKKSLMPCSPETR